MSEQKVIDFAKAQREKEKEDFKKQLAACDENEPRSIKACQEIIAQRRAAHKDVSFHLDHLKKLRMAWLFLNAPIPESGGRVS